MSKLLFIFERDMPTISITRDVFTHLKYFPEIQSNFMYLADVSPSDIDSHDVIIFMRPDNGYSWRIAQQARQAGHVVVTFCDDDLLNLPKTNPTIPWRKKGLIKTLGKSDVIWSSSRYILDKYKRYTVGKRTATIDTIVQPEELDGIDSKEDGGSVSIVYAASQSHSSLFEKYISPIVPRLADEFGDSLSFTFISAHPDVKGVKCEYIHGMPLLKYRKFMKERHFDIGVAPLHNDEFSKCKYFNKFLEYTTHGMVGVYSNAEPYTYVVKNGVNGMLADDDPDSWYQALSALIKEKSLRQKCVRNAVQYIKDDHSEKACIYRISEGIPEILATEKSYEECKSFGIQKQLYYLTRPMDWLYLLVFYLKNTGIKAVIRRIKTHFIEAKAYSRRNVK